MTPKEKLIAALQESGAKAMREGHSIVSMSLMVLSWTVDTSRVEERTNLWFFRSGEGSAAPTYWFFDNRDDMLLRAKDRCVYKVRDPLLVETGSVLAVQTYDEDQFTPCFWILDPEKEMPRTLEAAVRLHEKETGAS